MPLLIGLRPDICHRVDLHHQATSFELVRYASSRHDGWWTERGLSPRPPQCKCGALHLSYQPWSHRPDVRRAQSLTKRPHRCLCFDGWSQSRASNPHPSAYRADAVPLQLDRRGALARNRTWAANLPSWSTSTVLQRLATRTGIEPVILSLTGRCDNRYANESGVCVVIADGSHPCVLQVVAGGICTSTDFSALLQRVGLTLAQNHLVFLVTWTKTQ